MPDHIDKYTDQQEAAYARKIAATYKKAAQEVRRQITEFAAKHKAKAAKLLQQVNAGEISMADYQAWLQGQVFIGKQWQTKLDDIVRVYTDADEKARKLMRGTVRDVFTESANYAAYQLEDRLGAAVDFHLYDAKTVDRLMRTNPQMLPEWKINEPKDYRWNAQRVRSTLTRAIIEGKPIPDIAEELGQQLATGNAKKMVLFARTAMTGAQNAGRVERLHDTQQMGIRVKKKWLAAHDARVRDTHAYLDGQERDVDDDFTVGDMHIAYPGDPTAPPELVYNCRCTMIYVYPEHQAEHQGEKTESYEEWLEEKKGKEQQEEKPEAENVTEDNAESAEAVRAEVDRYNAEIRSANDEIAQIEVEYQELIGRQWLVLGTPEYDQIQQRIDELNMRSEELYKQIDQKRLEMHEYLGGAAEGTVRQAFGAISGDHSMKQDAYAVNLIRPDDPRSYQNCTYCSLAYDARRRGVDCKAPYIQGGSEGVYSSWWTDFSMKPTGMMGADAMEVIRRDAESTGPGTRGVISIDYGTDVGHMFAYEVGADGKCIFIDPQGGTTDEETARQLFAAARGGAKYGRTDDKELTRLALYYLEKGGWTEGEKDAVYQTYL